MTRPAPQITGQSTLDYERGMTDGENEWHPRSASPHYVQGWREGTACRMLREAGYVPPPGDGAAVVAWKALEARKPASP